jgi:type IX secretion system PorP/SprF family membrane protein
LLLENTGKSMNALKTRTLRLLIALTVSTLSFAQDAHFSQYYANPIYLNPAFAGLDRCPTVHTNYRNQYPELGVYQTYSASYDQYVDKLNGGVALMAMRDDAGNGALNLTEVSAVYSYHLEVNRKFSLLSGFQATFRQRALDWGQFTFPDMIDPFYGFVLPTNEVAPGNNFNNHLDLSFGMLGFTDKWYIGVVGHHLTEPNEAFLSQSKLPLKLTAHAGANIPIGRKRLHNSLQSYVVPNVVYQQQGSASQLTAGVSFARGPLAGGLAVRQGSFNPDAVIFILGITPPDLPWTFGYSYDYTISDLTNTLGGSHEVSLGYKLPCRTRTSKIRALKCPKF